MNNNIEQNTALQFPLSFHQERIFFIDEFETNNVYDDHPVYHHLPWIMQLKGCVDANLLQQALDQVVARHEVLRTGLIRRQQEGVDRVFQQIYSQRPLRLKVVNAEQQNDEQLLASALALIDQTFDLFTDPLCRATLLVQSDNHSYLVLVLHHLIADRQTLKIVHQELWALYHSLVTATPLKLPEPELQYVDFSQWQHQLPPEQLDTLFVEWQYALRNKPNALELPLDYPRPGMHVFKRGSVSAVLPPALLEQADIFCRQYGLKLEVLFCCAFTVLLHRYSGQEGIYFGTSFDLREDEHQHSLTGPVANLVVLNESVDAQLITSMLANQHQSYSKAEQYKAMPFDELVGRLKPAKDMSRTALFDVLLSIDTDGLLTLQSGGVTVSCLETNYGYGKYDFHLLLQRQPDTGAYLSLLVFNQELYAPYFAEQLNRHFAVVLQQVIENPERTAADIELLSPQEQQQILALGETAAHIQFPTEMTVVQRFEQIAKQYADQVALKAGHHSLTYRELNQLANQLAHHIIAKADSSGLVGICLKPSGTAVVAMLACLKAGRGYLPLDPTIPPERLSYILTDAHCELVIADEDSVALCQTFAVACLNLAQDEWRQHSDQNPGLFIDVESVAYSIYTSGSTGLPKGVLVSQQNLLRLFINDQPDFSFLSTDVWTVFHNLNFDFSVWEIYGALLFGGCTVLVDAATRLDPVLYLELLEQAGVTIVNQTPCAFYNLSRAYMARDKKNLKVRHIIFGGEALNPVQLRPWAERHPETLFVNMYGITETTVHVSYRALGSADLTSANSVIGRPIATASWYILDERQRPVPKGISGELYVGGAGVSKGYYNRPELTAQRFVDVSLDSGGGLQSHRLYRTGDKAKFAEHGEVVYLGRFDNQIQLRGFRIEPGEIQSRLLQLEYVVDAVVIATDQYIGQLELIAYLVSNTCIDEMLLRAELVKYLPEYMIPSVFVTVEQLPLTVNGKLDSKLLPDPTAWRQVAQQYLAPRNTLEAELAEIWQQHMRLPKVGVTDNFFEMGGHSLLATAITASILERYKVDLPIRVFFENPTIAYLAYWISAQNSAQDVLQMVHVVSELPVPLSFSQQRIWFIDKLDGGSPQYNMPLPLRIDGPFDPANFTKAANELLQQHDILRTVYEEVDGRVWQRVKPHVDISIALIDVSDLATAQIETTIAQHLQQEFAHTFNLAQETIVRFKLLKVAEQQHILFFNIHHIAADGVSMQLLVDELTRRYHGEAVARPQFQFADYVHWQRQWLHSDACQRELNYWKAQLAGIPQLHSLPTDKPRPGQQQTKGGLVRRTLNAAVSAQLKTTALQLNVTPNMLFQSVFALLLSKWSYETDIVFGVPIAGRVTEAMQSMIGYFSNTLVMRYKLDPQQTFADFMQDSRALILDAFEHQKLPFDSLVDDINPTRSLSYTPFYQIMFRYESAEPAVWQLPELSLKMLEFEDTLAKFDLALHVLEKEQGDTVLHWVYADSLFVEDRIELLADCLINLLIAVSQDATKPLTDYTLLAGTNRSTPAMLSGEIVNLPHRNVVAWFEQTASQVPDAIAAEYEGEVLTYAELDAKSNRLARFLQTRGVKPDTLVGLCMERSLEALVGIIAILKAGGAFVAMDPEYPADRLEWIIDDAAPVMVLSMSGLIDHLDLMDAPFLLDGCLAEDWAQGIASSSLGLASQLDGEHLAYVIYTSGSTGKPKGVLIKQQGLVNYLTYTRDFGMRAPVVGTVVNTSLGFDASITTLFSAMTTGGKVVLMPQHDKAQQQISKLIAESRQAYLFMLTPSHLELMALHWPQHFRCDVPHLMFIGGEVLPPEQVRWLREIFSTATLTNHYGPTETVVGCTMHQIDPQDAARSCQRVPIGTALYNCQLYVRNLYGEVCPQGVPGELYVGGAGVARGYLNRAELTAEKFVDGAFAGKPGSRFYATGDLVCLNAQRELEYISRIDQQVKIRGFRIEIGEIEQALTEQAVVQEAKVIVAEQTQQLIAFVTSNVAEEVTVLADGVKVALKQRLPDYMVPAHIIVLDALPMSVTGKLDSHKLRQLAAEIRVVKGRPPQTELELKLAAIWQDVLGVDSIGLDDDFFELGGHSLLVVRMLNQIEQQFGLALEVRAVFNMRRFVEQATLLQMSLSAPEAAGEEWESLEI